MACYSHDITSVVAYMIGVNREHFRSPGEEKYFADISVFEKLEKNKHARIIRCLCLCRTGFVRNFKGINAAVKGSNGIRSGIHGLYEYISTGEEAVSYLEKNGISYGWKHQAQDYLPEINTHIKDRINNCKSLFPAYVDWSYIQNLFVMPNGTTAEGCIEASEKYYSSRQSYPFYCYINWKKPDENTGKALYNDLRFLELLYRDNMSSFDRPELVTETSEHTQSMLQGFLKKGTKLFVDCENANPFYLYSFLKGLDETSFSNIAGVILFKDINSSSAWDTLENEFEGIEFETVVCERTLERKSLVDMRLATRAVAEYYTNNTRSFVIVSSDSDYCGLMDQLDGDAEFLLLMERKNSSPVLINKLKDEGTKFIYIEDYSYEDSFEFATKFMYSGFRQKIKESFMEINTKDFLRELSSDAFLKLETPEQESILRYIKKHTELNWDADYNLKVVFA